MARRDATGTGLKHALDILRSLYLRVQTLEEFSNGIVFSDGRKPVLTDDSDGARFQTLARGLMVCALTPLQPVRAPVQVLYTCVIIIILRAYECLSAVIV